jgi:peptide/nickel transport system substrate-binding protein
MARRLNVAVAVAAVSAVVLTGCGSPSSKGGGSNNNGGQQIQSSVKEAEDPTAKGPAADVPGAQKGGTITVNAQTTPNNFDPADTYYTDSNEIERLTFRTPTQYAIRDGNAVLVPDLTDLGTVSADNLTWTFKMQPGIKYEDGTQVKVDDLAYAIKRSFAHDLFPDGPTYQETYFKGGDTYKGPYKSGLTFPGVETQGTDTLIIHLSKAFPDLPYFMTFPLFTPIPQAKDTKANYKNHPLSTGPYMFSTYTAGSELKLVKNPNWDPSTDAVRHQYADVWDFKWGTEIVKAQQATLNSNGPDADTVEYDEVDSSLIPQLNGAKSSQLLQGQEPCTEVVQLDSRKIPLPVRKAVAAAMPLASMTKADGLNSYTADPATTFMPPSVPGYTKYTPPAGLNGAQAGDAAAAKQMLTAANALNFKLNWYYDNTKPISQQVAQVMIQGLKAAGFNPQPIGVTTADLRTKLSDYTAPVNMFQGPRGWCSDWPTGGSWFPVMFESSSLAAGLSWGELSDKTLDSQIDAVAALPDAQSQTKWGALDQQIMGQYVAIPWYYTKMADVLGTNIGGAVGDSTMGMPFFMNMYLKSPTS